MGGLRGGDLLLLGLLLKLLLLLLLRSDADLVLLLHAVLLSQACLSRELIAKGCLILRGGLLLLVEGPLLLLPLLLLLLPNLEMWDC